MVRACCPRAVDIFRPIFVEKLDFPTFELQVVRILSRKPKMRFSLSLIDIQKISSSQRTRQKKRRARHHGSSISSSRPFSRSSRRASRSFLHSAQSSRCSYPSRPQSAMSLRSQKTQDEEIEIFPENVEEEEGFEDVPDDVVEPLPSETDDSGTYFNIEEAVKRRNQRRNSVTRSSMISVKSVALTKSSSIPPTYFGRSARTDFIHRLSSEKYKEFVNPGKSTAEYRTRGLCHGSRQKKVKIHDEASRYCYGSS